ncbi:Centrosomal spindle body, CEP44-domain-containing protein [Globomyces pollinis-pini]|nr:Centrosomal spindle body, CEP44-domain-containing protein [Globomyces pollinis-pini]
MSVLFSLCLMATGDLRNNISKLESSLKTIKYPALLDSFGYKISLLIVSVSRGDPVAFLPLLHYVLLNYSPLLTKHFNSKGLDFFGKKDARFIETLYSALLDEFNYKPKISKEQFFTKGYAEQKCIFVNDVIRFLKELKASITRKNRVSTSGKNNLNPLIFNSNHTAAEPSIIRAKDYDQFQQDRIKNEIVLKELPTTETENISTKPSPFPPSKHSTNNFWAGNSWNNPNLPQIPIPQQYPIESYDQHTIDDSLLFYQAGQSFNQQYIQEDELNYSYNDSYIIANSSGLHQDIDNHGSSIDVEEKSSKPLQGLYENSHKPLLRKLDSELTSSTLDTIPNSDNFAKQVERNPESAINAHSTEPQQSNHNANSYITNSLISDERVIELERLLNESKSQQLELVQVTRIKY